MSRSCAEIDELVKAVAVYVQDSGIFITRAICPLSCAKRGGVLGRGLAKERLNPSSKNPEF